MNKAEIQLPKWLEHRYSILWNTFKDSPFGMEDAIKVLQEKNKDRKDEIQMGKLQLKKKFDLQYLLKILAGNSN